MSDNSICAAFYCQRGLTDGISTWYPFAVNWFDRFSQEPNRASVQERGKPPKQSTRFTSIDGWIKQNGFGKVQGISLSFNKSETESVAFGWTSCATYDGEFGAVFHCVDSTARDRFDLRDFAKDVCAQVPSISYGIHFERSRKRGPDLFALGMAAGLGYDTADLAEGDSIGRWFRRKDEIFEGRIRDVFPGNVLSRQQLGRDVGGLTLQHWIEQQPGRGILEELSEDLTFWFVPQDRIVAVRDQLRETGILIAWGPRSEARR